MMASNRSPINQRSTSKLLRLPLCASVRAMAMGVAVGMEPDKADPMRCAVAQAFRWLPGA